MGQLSWTLNNIVNRSFRLNIWAILFTNFACVFWKSHQKSIGPFYLLSVPVEVKDFTQGVNVQHVLESQYSEKEKLL